MNTEFAEFFLPSGILEYFEITNVDTSQESYQIYLEEKNVKPIEYSQDKLKSKGFFEQVKIQDYPIRGKSCFLLVKRRRWLNEKTGLIVYRDWELVAKGTRMTNEFATFLKGIYR